MRNNRILVIFVICLVVVNCGLLGMFWFNAYHTQKEVPLAAGGPAVDYITKELRLTPAQRSQYDKMRMAHRQFVDSVNERSHRLRDSFFEQLKNPAASPEKVNALGQRISTGMAMVDTSTFYHFARFRKILRPDQQKRFDQIIQQVLRSMSGPGAMRPPGLNRQLPENGPEGQRVGPPRDGRFRQGPPPRRRRPFGRPGEGPPPDGMPPPDGPPPGGPPPGGPPPGGPPPGGR